MGGNFFRLGVGDEFLPGAIELSKVAQVFVRPTTINGAKVLEANNFIPLVEALHVFASDNSLSKHPSRMRTLRTQQEGIVNIGVDITVITGAELTSSGQLEKIYVEQIVPCLLMRGIAPHGANFWPTFQQLASKSVFVIGTALNGSYAGISIFQLRSVRLFSFSGTYARQVAVGMIEAVNPAFQDIKRAWRHSATRALTQKSIAVSLGADDCFIDERYLPIIRDKMQWYSEFGFEVAEIPEYVSPLQGAKGSPFKHFISINDSMPTFTGNWESPPASTIINKLNTYLHKGTA